MIKYKKDELVECLVTGIENYGIFIRVDYEYSGLIHISEISEDYVRNINDYVTVGERINAKIIEIDEDYFRMKLSIKNIDYKINKDSLKIIESPNGFGPLVNNLKNWTEKKLKEFEE